MDQVGGPDPRPVERRPRSGSGPVAALVLALAIAAGMLTAFNTAHWPDPPVDLPVTWIAIAIAFGIAEIAVAHLPFGRNTYSFSLSELPLIVGLTALTPVGCLSARVVGSAAGLALQRVQPVKLVFNMASLALDTAVATLVYRSLLGDGDPIGPAGWSAALAAAVVVLVLDTITIGTVIALQERTFPRGPATETLLTGGLAAINNASLAVVALVLLDREPLALFALAVVAGVVLLAYRGWTSLSRRHARLATLHDFVTVTRERSEAEGPFGDAAIETMLQEACKILRAGLAELVVGADADDPAVRFRVGEHGALERLDPAADPDGWWTRVPPGTALCLPRSGPACDPTLLGVIGARDALIAPVHDETGAPSTILVADRLDDVTTFDQQDLRLLETLAGHVRVELENRRLFRRLVHELELKEYQALHDSLTTLRNRRAYTLAVADSLARGERLAVVLIDLDRFKEINDTLGHTSGDQVLVAVAARLEQLVKPVQAPSRFSGDLFGVIIPIRAGVDPIAVAAELRALLQRPVVIGDLAVDVTASMGMAIAPEHGDDADLLIQRADVALHLAKDQQSGIELYDRERDVNDVRRLALVTELRNDVARGRLQIFYQPKASLVTGRFTGVEALVRWHSSRFGWVRADEFVPLAELTGLIRPLTEHVLAEALRQQARWHEAGLDVRVAVNLSVRSLLDVTLPDIVLAALARAGVGPAALTLEITESTIMRDPDRNVMVLQRLDDLGVELSIDDFGTGHSSLLRLKGLPAREVKIDQQFVSTMAHDPQNRAIVKNIIRLGHDLNLRVAAEGVEDMTTWRLLAEAGCDIAQGFLFGEPRPAEELEDLLRSTVDTEARDPKLL